MVLCEMDYSNCYVGCKGRVNMRTCKCCGKEYDEDTVRRSLGADSRPYLLGYCSARCYTRDVIEKNSEPKEVKRI